uniref:Reverse transcriptase/retrotransposon-derived protein RNase H-like domain-containing protein n=1 Tax=Lepeophtheirus salmonis TaxID=72036 RepID=A0A0K2TZT5_LEPSM
MRALDKHWLTMNENKCKYSTARIKLLVSQIENGMMKPDPDRLKSLMRIHKQRNEKELRRILVMFPHYLIPSFSKKLHSMVHPQDYTWNTEAKEVCAKMKKNIENAVVNIVIDPLERLTVDTDAS